MSIDERSNSSAVPEEIPLSRPQIGPIEKEYVQSVLDSPRLAFGPWLEAFEERMAGTCGTRHAVAVSGGTAALHLLVRALDLKPGDEVVTTPFSFVASSNVLLYENVQPRFVDIDPATYNLDVERVERALGPKTKAILAVDVFGLPADWPALTQLAQQHGLRLIDDACEALGAHTGGRPVGAWGDGAAFGFYPNKQITTGEGGCVTTDSDEVAALCRSLRNQGRADDRRMEHVRLGYNYRMDELSAALGCAQLDRLSELQQRRERVATWYRDALDEMQEDLVLPASGTETAWRSWFVYVIQLRDHVAPDARDQLMERLTQQGIGCAPYFPSIHLQPYYRQTFGFTPGDFPVCERVSARTLALPFYADLTREQVQRVAGTLRDAMPQLPRATSHVAVNGSVRDSGAYRPEPYDAE